MNEIKNEDGVVSIFDPKTYPIEWREIPGFSKYAVSTLGVVKHKRHNKTPKIIEVVTSKGTYLRVSALSDDGRHRSKELHHLVCLGFHGVPDGDPANYEVNHLNGNKHFNCPTNVEWTTRRDNLIHAYKTGLRTDVRRVLVHDHITGNATEYYSMSEVARVFGVGKGAVWNLISSHKRKHYRNRYTFEFIAPERYVVRKADNVFQIAAFDYVNKELYVADDLGTMELLTGIKRSTISWQLKSDNPRLLKGIWFRYVGQGDENFPTFTDEEIQESLVRSNIGNPIYVTDTLSNTTELYGSINKFAKAIGKDPSVVRRAKNNDGMFQHYRING